MVDSLDASTDRAQRRDIAMGVSRSHAAHPSAGKPLGFPSQRKIEP